MPDFSYKLSELPENLMISPKFLFDWWDGVIEKCGPEKALTDKSSDFKLARELWVAAVFACCKSLSSKKEHWASAVSEEAPDALVAYFETDSIGAFRQVYPIEVTECRFKDIETIIKKKLDKAYQKETRIICYITHPDGFHLVDTKKLSEFISKNNPSNYEVWVLGSFIASDDSKQPIKLYRLTGAIHDYQIDLSEEKTVANSGEAVLVPDKKSVNKDGKLNKIGKLTLQFPDCEA